MLQDLPADIAETVEPTLVEEPVEELAEEPVEELAEEEDISITQEDMEEVALRALGRMTLQELIDDSVSALVEVYTARPESYLYDAMHYNDADRNQPSPFMDLIQYLKDVREDESPRDNNS